MSKELTAIYFAWFRQVVEDEVLPAAAFKLAFVYQQHMSSDRMKAFAGQARLAKCVGVSARSIRTLTKLLKDRGHLDVETNHGPNQTNICRLVLNRKSASSFDDDTKIVFLSAIDANEEAGFLINEEAERTKRGNFASKNRKSASDKSLLNHFSNQTRTRRGRKGRPADDRVPLVLTTENWNSLLATFVRTGHWTRHVDQAGNAPPASDCKAPKHLLIKHGIICEVSAA